MRHSSSMDRRTCILQYANENYGMGIRLVCDDGIVMEFDCPTHIIFRAGFFSVTITLSPKQYTVHLESMQH